MWSRLNHYPFEPIFVPRPDAVAEDDGVVMTTVLDGPEGRSYLLILDARTMDPVATVYAPIVQPMAYHAEFFAGHSGANTP